MIKNKVLIIQTAFLGDAILTLPLIQEASKKFPDSQIDVIAIPSTETIFASSPFVRKVFVLDKKGKQKSILSLIKFSLQIRKTKYSKIISPHRSFRTSLLILFAGAKDTTGFDIAALNLIYTNKIKYRKDRHEVWRNLRLLNEKEYFENWRILPEIEVGSEAKSKVKNLFNEINSSKIAAVAIGSVWNTKKYPAEYFAKIIKYLRSKSYKIILIGGNEDRRESEEISKKFDKGVKSFAGNLSIIESVEFLRQCDFLICNDSAPTHMGMAADIPVLTLYCSTVPDFGFYPYNEKSFYLSYDELDCKPCGIHGHNECPLGHFNCGKFLKPEKVIETLNEKFL